MAAVHQGPITTEVAAHRFVARTQDVVVEELDGGLVIYDGREAQAHWLDPSATAVWRACREPRTEAEIAGAAGLEGPTCGVVLYQLIDLGLVEPRSGPGYSRRAVIQTAAKLGLAGAIGAPIISAVVPAAAAALSAMPAQPQPPAPGVSVQTLSADRNFVPGPPGVSDVTVIVGSANKQPPTGFSINHATVNRHGVIVLTLSARSAGAFSARASFHTVQVGSNKRLHSQGAYGSGSAIVAKRGSVKLKILPTTAAARALARGAHLAVAIATTFTPVGGAARSVTARLTIS